MFSWRLIKIQKYLQYSIKRTDVEEALFADADSIDAVPSRPNVRRSLRYLNSIQISDDEMDAVRIEFFLIVFLVEFFNSNFGFFL